MISTADSTLGHNTGGPSVVSSKLNEIQNKKSKNSLTKQKERTGMLAVLPAFIIVAGLLFYPIGYAI